MKKVLFIICLSYLSPGWISQKYGFHKVNSEVSTDTIPGPTVQLKTAAALRAITAPDVKTKYLLKEQSWLFYYDANDATSKDDSIFVIVANNSKRYKRIFPGKVTAATLNITGNNTSQASKINTLLSNVTVSEINFDDPSAAYAINGRINVPAGKTLRFVNGAKLKGDGGGNDTISNALIDADIDKQVFDTDLVVLHPLNKLLHASWFGFLPASSAKKNTAAIHRINEAINSGGGGTIKLLMGQYTIGYQNFAGEKGKGYAYLPNELFYFHGNIHNIVIDGNGAMLKLADGLRYGAFHPVTGVPYASPSNFYASDYSASPDDIIHVINNKSVTIRNLKINGNLPHMIIGGTWGDVGIQLGADAIQAENNSELLIENVEGFQCGRDGLSVGNTNHSATDPVFKVNVLNSNFDGNGRQGLSFVRGNHFYARNSKFQNTGRTFNIASGKRFVSQPGAGVDLEAEDGLIRNIIFDSCLVYNNVGAGFLTVGDVADVTVNKSKIIGTTGWSLYGSGSRTTFNSTTIVGSMVNLFGAGGFANSNATKFSNCLLTLDTLMSPNHQVYGNYICDFGGGAVYAKWSNCKFNASNRNLFYNGIGSYENCLFTQTSTSQVNVKGSVFSGTNRFVHPFTPIEPDSTSLILGPVFVNGIQRLIKADINNSRSQASIGKAVNSVPNKYEHLSSYLNSGGIGNRASIITVTATPGLINGVPGHFVDGAFFGDFSFVAQDNKEKEVKFDFGPGASKIITEARFYEGGPLLQDYWKWQGSTDNKKWTDIGGPFMLGNKSSGITVITTLSENTNAYRYYRMLGVGGRTDQNNWQWEMEFKIYDASKSRNGK